MAEAVAMSSVALAALLGLRAMGILAPVSIEVLVGTTVVSLAVSSAVSDWKRALSRPMSK